MAWITVDTPTGAFSIEERGGRVVAAGWGVADSTGSTAVLEEAARQVGEYFNGTRHVFDLPLQMAGGLAGRVGALMLQIPFGGTRTYGELAHELGVPAQAIGQACGANPIPLIIPCHRILSASGLGGFSGAGGVETKVALLRHEGAAGLLI